MPIHVHQSREAAIRAGNPLRRDPFFVPPGQKALLIRNGLPEQVYPSGLQSLPLAGTKVEVRLLAPEASRLQPLAPPDSGALELPYERSYLFVDGELVGIVRTSPVSPGEPVPDIRTWEGFNPSRERQEQYQEALRACLTEPLRACFPASGVCCGGRMGSLGLPSQH